MATTESHSIGSIEALLYMSGEGLSQSKLQILTGMSEQELAQSLNALKQRYEEDASGLMLIEHAEVVEIATKPQFAQLVERFTKSFVQETLSKAALEVLAIIAYRGPITRASLESIRGVNCSFTLRNLLIRGLITRSENPHDTREYVYTASLALFEKLGLSTQEGLPDFQKLSQDIRLQEAEKVTPEGKEESIL